jgi:hypothetical protein
VSVYSKTQKGYAMMNFDSLPPRLRDLVREDPNIDAGFILIAIDDGMPEDEIIEETKQGTAWWMK